MNVPGQHYSEVSTNGILFYLGGYIVNYILHNIMRVRDRNGLQKRRVKSI